MFTFIFSLPSKWPQVNTGLSAMSKKPVKFGYHTSSCMLKANWKEI